jgi:hypothetical protein
MLWRWLGRREHPAWRAFAWVLLAVLPATASAQSADRCADQPAVYAVSASAAASQPAGGVREAYLNDAVSVGVCKLDALLTNAKTSQKEITLFINGMDAGLKPTAIDQDGNRLTFILERQQHNRELWKPLLANPFAGVAETLRFSVGLVGDRPLPRLPTANSELPFKKLRVNGWTYAGAALILAVLIATLYFGKNSDMLRDAPSVDGVRQSYSLARVQMAWWFVLVVGGYVAILLVSGEVDAIPATIVVLTGISASTGLAATLITPRAAQRAAAIKALLAEQCASLDEAITDLGAVIADTDQKLAAAQAAGQPTQTLADLKQRLQERKDSRQRERDHLTASLTGISPVSTSDGFWRDLVTGDRGTVALDRLQMVVWTVLLGGMFLQSVLAYVTMPDFNSTLLALMGVSSGTYIGFKKA